MNVRIYLLAIVYFMQGQEVYNRLKIIIYVLASLILFGYLGYGRRETVRKEVCILAIKCRPEREDRQGRKSVIVKPHKRMSPKPIKRKCGK